jgi:hypothetical protein
MVLHGAYMKAHPATVLPGLRSGKVFPHLERCEKRDIKASHRRPNRYQRNQIFTFLGLKTMRLVEDNMIQFSL